MSLVHDAMTDARALHALLNAGHWGVEGARMRGGDGTGRSGAKAAGAWRQKEAAVYNNNSVGTPATPAPLQRDHKTDTSAVASKSGQPTEATSLAAGIDWSVISVSAAQAATPAPPPGLPLSPKIDWSTRKRDRKRATASSGSQNEEASGWSVRPSEHPGQMLWYNVSTGDVDWVPFEWPTVRGKTEMFSLEFGREEEPRPDPTMLVGESASGASAPEAKHCRDALPSSPSIPSLHRWRGVPTSRSFAGLRVGNFGASASWSIGR